MVQIRRVEAIDISLCFAIKIMGCMMKNRLQKYLRVVIILSFSLFSFIIANANDTERLELGDTRPATCMNCTATTVGMLTSCEMNNMDKNGIPCISGSGAGLVWSTCFSGTLLGVVTPFTLISTNCLWGPVQLGLGLSSLLCMMPCFSHYGARCLFCCANCLDKNEFVYEVTTVSSHYQPYWIKKTQEGNDKIQAFGNGIVTGASDAVTCCCGESDYTDETSTLLENKQQDSEGKQNNL